MQVTTQQQIILIETPPYFAARPGQQLMISRENIADYVNALMRVTTGERREGVIDLARALGIVAVERR